jgi:hypothetical protein
MMQNGFRRIALAQGLLPERSSPRETQATAEGHESAPLTCGEADHVAATDWDNGADLRVAGVPWTR